MDRQIQLLARAQARISIGGFDVFLARWRDQTDQNFRDKRNAQSWQTGIRAIDDVGGTVRSLNADIRGGFKALGGRLDVLGADIVAAVQQQSAQLISSQRQLFADQVAWDQHQSSFAFRACRAATSLAIAREIVALKADLDELDAAAELVLARIAPLHDAYLVQLGNQILATEVARERLGLEEQLASRRADLARLRHTMTPKGGIFGAFLSTAPTSDQLNDTRNAERDIAKLVDCIALAGRQPQALGPDTKIRATAAVQSRKLLLEQAATSGDLQLAAQLLALAPAGLKALPPEVDYDIALACEEAGLSECPGFGRIPTKAEMPAIMIELKSLSTVVAAFPYGNPISPRIESMERLRAFFGGDDATFLEQWRMTSAERHRALQLARRKTTATRAASDGAGDANARDAMYDQAVEIVLQHKRASISLVQRHLRIGYNQAARLLEQMEENGMVTAMSTNGNREIIAL